MRSLYSDHSTWLHAVPAGAKLAALALLGTLLFVFDSPLGTLALSAVALGLFASLGRATRPAWRLIVMVGVAAVLVALFHLWLGQAWLGLANALRLVSAAMLGALLTLTTRFDALLAVFEALLAPLQRLGIRTEGLALGLGLMLRFTEHFFVQWRRLDDAYRARTGRAGGLRLLAPLTIRMLVTARRVADALAARLGR
ncbi:MAG: Energy-coupling factor transporter transmembrane protein BioN [Paracidovorax wautersii]|uniref:Energy-coupling factor transporter transmembrane protein BioN n=1 Tax=Paracidovorax wautersii TaxID=1177982 RepID=A0A7V8FLC7_9BURK|nr:MAG: Energy-coupling factor transporter transmembrane protein BioN [Paracidovorax wautersii]